MLASKDGTSGGAKKNYLIPFVGTTVALAHLFLFCVVGAFSRASVIHSGETARRDVSFDSIRDMTVTTVEKCLA